MDPEVDHARPGSQLDRDTERAGLHRRRPMDAWHLSCAAIALPLLAEADEIQAFATRNAEQAAAARGLGLRVV